MQFGCVPIAFDSFPAVHDVIISGETGGLIKSFSKKNIYKLTHLMEDEIIEPIYPKMDSIM